MEKTAAVHPRAWVGEVREVVDPQVANEIDRVGQRVLMPDLKHADLPRARCEHDDGECDGRGSERVDVCVLGAARGRVNHRYPAKNARTSASPSSNGNASHTRVTSRCPSGASSATRIRPARGVTAATTPTTTTANRRGSGMRGVHKADWSNHTTRICTGAHRSRRTLWLRITRRRDDNAARRSFIESSADQTLYLGCG